MERLQRLRRFTGPDRRHPARSKPGQARCVNAFPHPYYVPFSLSDNRLASLLQETSLGATPATSTPPAWQPTGPPRLPEAPGASSPPTAVSSVPIPARRVRPIRFRPLGEQSLTGMVLGGDFNAGPTMGNERRAAAGRDDNFGSNAPNFRGGPGPALPGGGAGAQPDNEDDEMDSAGAHASSTGNPGMGNKFLGACRAFPPPPSPGFLVCSREGGRKAAHT